VFFDASALPPGQGQSAIHFPALQKFDVASLTKIMTEIREGNWP